jgi:hypothetical protein
MHLEILASAVPRLHQEAYGKMTPKRPGYHVIYDEETNKGCVWCDRHTLYTHTHSLSHKYTKYARTHTHTHTHTNRITTCFTSTSPKRKESPPTTASKIWRTSLVRQLFSARGVVAARTTPTHTQHTHTHPPSRSVGSLADSLPGLSSGPEPGKQKKRKRGGRSKAGGKGGGGRRSTRHEEEKQRGIERTKRECEKRLRTQERDELRKRKDITSQTHNHLLGLAGKQSSFSRNLDERG